MKILFYKLNGKIKSCKIEKKHISLKDIYDNLGKRAVLHVQYIFVDKKLVIREERVNNKMKDDELRKRVCLNSISHYKESDGYLKDFYLDELFEKQKFIIFEIYPYYKKRVDFSKKLLPPKTRRCSCCIRCLKKFILFCLFMAFVMFLLFRG